MPNSTDTYHEISKLTEEDFEALKTLSYINHGAGVIQFKKVLGVPQDKVLPYIDEYSYVPSCGFQIREREDGSKYIIDGEGNEGSYEKLLELPMRLGGYAMHGPVETYTSTDIKDFFVECEKSLYRCLIRYIDIFPMISNTLWWKNRGHVLKYVPGASLGIHNDNDTNYRVHNNQRYFTSREVAMYQVANALVYFNDDYEGGEFYFPYLDLTLKPEVGDIVFFPANYIGTHGVSEVTKGQRYTYLAQYGHGETQGGEIVEALDSKDWLPPVYFPFLHQDYKQLLDRGLSDYDRERDKRVGFHASDIYAQQRSTEGEPVGTVMPYDDF
ncbi:MAG: 2OG-Fe(II) oxygenase [Bacteroidetes bacterium]|nr:2OG-Fe(II) oxygenase [Bacteroidota bacterium]